MGQRILLGPVAPGCVGGTVPVSFTVTGAFEPGNQFKVTFNNQTGAVASVTENVSAFGGNIRIPDKLRPGFIYQIQVEATKPAVGSNFVDFEVSGTPSAQLIPPTVEAILNPGDPLLTSVALSGGGPYTIQFTDGQSRTFDNVFQAPVTLYPTESRTYQLATVSNRCGVSGASGTVPVTVRGAGLLVTRLSTTEPCAGQPLLIYYSTDRPLPDKTPFRVDFLPVQGGQTYQAAAVASGTPNVLRVNVPTIVSSGVYRLRLSSETANMSAYYRDFYEPVASLVTLRRPPTVRLTGSATINFGQTAQLPATIAGAGSGVVTFSDGTERPFTAYEQGAEQTLSLQPQQTTTYTVQRVNSGCAPAGPEAGSGSATVTVRSGYRIDSLSSTSVCTGQPFQVFFTTNDAVSTNAGEYSLRGATRYTGSQLQAGLIEFQVQSVAPGAQPNTGILTAVARPLPADYLTNATYNRDGPLGAGQFYCQLARGGNAGNVYGQPLAVATPPQLSLRGVTQTVDRPQLTYLLADLVSHASPTDVTLSDGSRVSVRGEIDFSQKTSTVAIEALAQPNTAFTVTSVQNVCGVGTAQGSAAVQVRGDTTALFMRPIAPVICGNSPVSVAFATVGTFPANTTYRVEIMENDGLFKGRYLASGTVSPINVTVPAGYTLFNSVQLRVVASSPASGTAVVVSAARAFTYLDPSQIVKLSFGGFGATETVIRPGEVVPLRIAAGGGNQNTPIELTLSNGQKTTFAGVGTDVPVRPTQTTTYTIRSVRNVCGAATGTGTVTVRVQPFLWQPQLQQTAYCEGDSLGVVVVGQGNVPGNATHSIQLIRSENVVQTLPARLSGNRLMASLPGSLSVATAYAVRVLSAVGQDQYYSLVSAGTFRVNRIPRLQLSPPNGQTAVVLEANQNSVNVQLVDPANAGASTSLLRPYRYRINDQFYNTIDNLPVTVPVVATNARPTSYSISAVYDAYCGFGNPSGSVRVSYKPGLRSLVVNKTQFCRNSDQATVAYEISGDFDANARFTVFLTGTTGTRFPVAESANPVDRLTFPISSTVPPSTYQVTLVSSVTGLPGFDVAPVITVGDVPRVVIAGGNAIQYADQPVTVGVRVASGFLPVSLTFTNGTVQTLSTLETTLSFPAQQSGTYQIAQVSNGCGVGDASGAVSLTVLPPAPNELRVTNVGPTGDVQGICQGGVVTVTVDAKGSYGTNNVFTLYLSDTTGLNYRPLPTQFVVGGVLTAQLPADLAGSGYRLRVGASNPAVLGASSAIFTIRPSLQATISGPTQVRAGELVPIVISLNNTGPWSLTLSNSIYGTEVLVINESPFFYRVRPDAPTTYTLLGVYNLQCGRGRASGSLTVSLFGPLAIDPNVPVAATIAPNPTAGFVRVAGTLPKPQRITLRLTDLQGRTLLERDLGPVGTLAHDVDLSTYPAGTYLLSVDSASNRTVFKVVKQ